MPSDFIPSREAELVTWSVNYRARIVAAPLTMGLSVAQATLYGTLHDLFVAGYNLATNEGGNTTANVELKNVAKANLIANARLTAGIIQKFPGTTNAMRLELGLTPKGEPSPIPPPAAAPDIDIVSVSGNTVRLRLHDAANPTRRGKPVGVAGAVVYSFVGAAAPASLSDWRSEGNTPRTTVEVLFPASTPAGSKVWFTAVWFNPRQQNGPSATPVATNIAGGAAMAA